MWTIFQVYMNFCYDIFLNNISSTVLYTSSTVLYISRTSRFTWIFFTYISIFHVNILSCKYFIQTWIFLALHIQDVLIYKKFFHVNILSCKYFLQTRIFSCFTYPARSLKPSRRACHRKPRWPPPEGASWSRTRPPTAFPSGSRRQGEARMCGTSSLKEKNIFL